jgi:hypothetical protein
MPHIRIGQKQIVIRKTDLEAWLVEEANCAGIERHFRHLMAASTVSCSVAVDQESYNLSELKRPINQAFSSAIGKI